MVSRELSPQYNPKEVEDKIYRTWEKSGFFDPDKLPQRRVHGVKRKTYCITVPPPNITGSLHMGHALNATIQDILIRKKRMEGYKTLWLPGTDHAGIAAQNIVEKELKKEGVTRYDLGREKFLERVWQWKEKYGHIILDQFKKLGASMDWSRTRFTMDAEYQEAVRQAFLYYYKKGWIYQAERVVNWCSRCATSLSDLELEYQEVKSLFYYIKYPLADGGGFIIVATTRPETMLGDAAVAVNPKDERYKKLVGSFAILPLKERKIPIVADDAVETKFGTGAVKVTPAHDLLDAEIAERHKLPTYKVIGPDGKMTAEAEPICPAGCNTAFCRDKVVAELKSLGLIEKTEEYQHNIAVCYRCATVIEPIPSLQWFLRMGKLTKPAIKAAKSGKVKFHPKRWEKVYFEWLKNVKDWTISRQIWWGHKIPVGLCIGCGEIKLDPKIKGNWFFVRHGETDWNKEKRIQGQSGDTSLNEAGRAQAKETGKRLLHEKIDLIISSDLVRARQTAEFISQTTGAEVLIDPRLRERNYGVLEGKTREEILKDGLLRPYYDNIKEYGETPLKGESPRELEDRIWDALSRHKNHHAHRNIVIVSHGAALRQLLRKLKSLPQAAVYEMELHNAEILHFRISEDPCNKCGNDFIELEVDVLDTWFSSALWPFATLGWPASVKTSAGKPQPIGDLREFYPTQVLSTARDIINLWVGRMIFSSLEFTGEPPFRDVLIHATILTKEGKRMSKSLGTGVDPLGLIEKYGADATRFGLIWQAQGGQDIHWSEEHVIAGKKFANKIWNASRFVLTQLSAKHYAPGAKPKTPADKKIVAALEKTKKEVDRKIEKYDFGQALHALYDFFWHEFCDKYIETSKSQMTDAKSRKNTREVLLYVLASSIKLLHPFMPFVTEEIWKHLPKDKSKKIKDKNALLIVAGWPK